jgi:hypothetical protein
MTTASERLFRPGVSGQRHGRGDCERVWQQGEALGHGLLVHVPGARAHADELSRLLAVQEHRVLDAAALVKREVGAQLLVQAVGLVLGDREEAERPDELEEVAGRGGHGEQRAARREHARHLRRVARRKHAQDQRRDSVFQRKRLPRIRPDCRGAQVGAGRAAKRGS